MSGTVEDLRRVGDVANRLDLFGHRHDVNAPSSKPATMRPSTHSSAESLRMCLDDFLRRHAEVLVLGGALGDLDVRSGDHGLRALAVDVDGKRLHRLHGSIVPGAAARLRLHPRPA